MTSPDQQQIDLIDRLTRLSNGAAIRGLTPVLTIAQSVREEPLTAWHAATRSEALLLGNLEAADAAAVESVIEAAAGTDIEIWLDASSKGPQSQLFRDLLIAHPHIGIYSDLAVWSEAILALVLQHLTPGPMSALTLVGASPLTDAVAKAALQYGYEVTRNVAILGAEPGPQALIGTSFHRPVIQSDMLKAIARDQVAPLCIDGGIGSFTADALAYARAQQWPVWRPDMRGALSAAIAQARQYRSLLTRHAGSRDIDGVTVVAGGLLGAAGDLVVDRLDDAMEILGWADGLGGLVTETTDPDWLAGREKVEVFLIHRSHD